MIKNTVATHTTLRVYKGVPLQQKEDGCRENFQEAKGPWSVITLATYPNLIDYLERYVILDLLT